MAREITFELYIAWDFSNYVNESARLESATGDMGYMPPGEGFTSGRGLISSMTLTLNNADGYFSPLNTGSSIYTHIQNGKAYHAPCYLRVSIDGGSNYHRVFTGVIKWPEVEGGTVRDGSTVEIECRSNEEKLLQVRNSTTLADFAGYYNEGINEAQLIYDWLTNAGVDGGDTEIDSGVFTIPWAWLDDESPIEECWRLAAACAGRFYCTPEGKFKFENAYYWATATESTTQQEAFTVSNWGNLRYGYDDRDLFDSVLVEAAPRVALSPDVLWTPDEEIQINSGETRTITARLRQPAYSIDAPTFTAVTTGGTDITGSVTISATNYAQRVVMEITNAHASHAAVLKPLQITGRTVSGSITIEEERNAADHGSNGAYFSTRGGRRKSVRGNVYIQSRAHAAMVATQLLIQTETPRLTFYLTGVPGDPERRLGWNIGIEDVTTMSTGRNAIITRIKWKLNGQGFSQDIEAIDRSSLFPYSEYFVIGTNVLGASGAGIARLYF